MPISNNQKLSGAAVHRGASLYTHQVTDTKIKTYVNKNMYEIGYEVYIIDDNLNANNFLAVLEDYVNRTFVFNKDFVRNRS